MNVPLEMLRPAATGCVDWTAEEKGLFPDRMTHGLRAYFDQREGWAIRRRCPAGVRLRFRSDTLSLRLTLRFGRHARPIFTSDLYVDGAFHATVGPSGPMTEWSAEVFAARARAMREYDLWLPCMAECWIAALEIGDGARFEPVTSQRPLWLAIGDSITQGMTATTPSRTYVGTTARALNLNVHNIGVGGGIFAREIGAAVKDIPCAVATVAFGVNDWNGSRPLTEFREEAAAFLSALLQSHPDLPVGLMTPLPTVGFREKNDHEATLEDYRETIGAVAKNFRKVKVIDGLTLAPPEAEYFVDGCHPNDRGMAAVAANLAPHVRYMIS